MASSETKKIVFDISTLALFKILVALAIVVLLVFIRDIILVIFVALILASAFDPWVDWMQKFKIPRALGILLIYLVAILILSSVIYLIIPPIAIEVKALANDFPAYWDSLSGGLEQFKNYSNDQGWTSQIQDSLNQMKSNTLAIEAAAGGVFSTIFSFFGGIFSFFIVAVLAFYLTIEEHAMKRILRSLVSVKYQPYVTHLVNRIQEKIGRWLRGQLILSFIIFIISWIGLTLLGVKYALVLALFTGIMELIPYLGPFIGAVPAVFIALTQSPALALGVIILYVIIQWLENNLIVPKIMQKAVGLNPIITIIAMMVGLKLAGVLGVVLAIPVATAISVVVGDLMEEKTTNK